MAGIYQQLDVWKRAIQLAVDIYQATSGFPRAELYGLVTQLRRAAVSVPSNIAEGQGRRTRGEALQFLGIARGSLLEVETQLIVAQRLGYLPDNVSTALRQRIEAVGRPLAGLMRTTSARPRFTR